MDESLCRLQDSSFQGSLDRECTVPVWVGMGWLGTRNGDFLQSKQYTARHSFIRLTRAKLKLQFEFVDRVRFHPTPQQNQKECDREVDCRASL